MERGRRKGDRYPTRSDTPSSPTLLPWGGTHMDLVFPEEELDYPGKGRPFYIPRAHSPEHQSPQTPHPGANNCLKGVHTPQHSLCTPGIPVNFVARAGPRGREAWLGPGLRAWTEPQHWAALCTAPWAVGLPGSISKTWVSSL